jgi:CHAD domain-containing protein
MSIDEKDDGEDLQSSTRDAVADGAEVRERVRAITVAALEQGRLNAERIRQVTEAVMEGASEGAKQHAESAGNAFQEALGGIDEALAKAAHASQLAIEEARARMSEFSEQDLANARRELEGLEQRFLDVLDDVAARSDAVFKEMMENSARHMRSTGTAVGRQVATSAEDLAEEIRKTSEAQFRAAADQALKAGAQIAQMASGLLAGLADSLEAQRKPDDDEC